ncbi:Plasmodium exported protein (PHIST), unknown function [Plasmodium ovale wallikeri]|uniref:Plasmodium RESA N-terminal domain-containing protein n=1 Tax=Plasmodium ovale wallikeri TaxID=864142 RepID=A0A1A8YLN1_PLAOA|nr:Plasmodium exported protein (PHIST), unknown function [Plasmodium ovale wallikeri]SBT32438.1 Plasmodium exported protein (PHIST), unknown function [Plasmodium ovale wallikeri]
MISMLKKIYQVREYPLISDIRNGNHDFPNSLEDQRKSRKKDFKNGITWKFFFLSILAMLYLFLQNANTLWTGGLIFTKEELYSKPRKLSEKRFLKDNDKNINTGVKRVETRTWTQNKKEYVQTLEKKPFDNSELSSRTSYKMAENKNTTPKMVRSNDPVEKKNMTNGKNTSFSVKHEGYSVVTNKSVESGKPLEKKTVYKGYTTRNGYTEKKDNGNIPKGKPQPPKPTVKESVDKNKNVVKSNINKEENIITHQKGTHQKSTHQNNPPNKLPVNNDAESGNAHVEDLKKKKNEDPLHYDITKYDMKDIHVSIESPDYEKILLGKYNKMLESTNMRLPYGCKDSDFCNNMSYIELNKLIEGLNDVTDAKSMFIIYKHMHDFERKEYLKIRDVLWKMCEDITLKYKIPKEIKIKEWNAIFSKLIEELLKKDKTDFTDLHNLIKEGNNTKTKFVKFLDQKRNAWKAFTSETWDTCMDLLATNLIKHTS